MVECSYERMEDKIKTFSKFGDTGKGGITRFSLSEEAIAARCEFVKRMEAIGASIVTDDMANLYATIPGTEDLPAIFSGSHMDSVRQGGNYDGILGVLTAMEVAETIVKEKIPHKHPITVIVWTNEEGARFEPAMMSSGVICGKFDKAAMLASEAKDRKGYTFSQALEESGFKGEEKNRMNPAKTKALVELHIEQGPVLEAEGIDIGVVEGVCGMINYEFTFIGQAGHAGTTPMKYRKDALYAAVKTIQYLHDELDQLDSKLVYTTGKISAHPNIHTIIPDEVKFTLDARHQDPEVIKQVLTIIKKIPSVVEQCKVSYEEAWSRRTVSFTSKLVDYVEKSAREFGYSNRRIYSGPGHDAQFVIDLVPTTMIFVPSVGGHSHCEIEYTPVENCLKGANVLLHTILHIDKE
ncbi:Zn-dependent hydrolase [Candidatus Galacturonibacter soehngenii]|uniref:Zn-dependent hydrolase n=1 Tax=Candidatus Galacturonatibacter soehngenii TaxID=2307010 RepID=A0A7V7UHC0_9FIRM|nr:Zn-dependent hydrolase [Candidatus Galacturonibacter soehngenii]KAB1439828.1 Zn-dependent hydrolase [Candidatus Galacturonibacter soehngenii]MBA4685936.1 Zn-dependent hydrolase [Candidatus Galacturonibacter soehngenii]